MDKRKYIPMFLDWPEVTCALSWEEKGRLVEAMALYARGDDYEACLVGNERFLFPALRGAIDRMAALSRKRSEAGRRGGMRSAGPGKADDGIAEQDRACGETDALADDGFQAETDLCKAEQSEAGCAEGDYNNNNEYNNKNKYNNQYNNENEEPKGERLSARARARRFTPPTVEEVMDYSDSMGYGGFDAHRFVDYYAANGWQVGRSPMRDWRASVRNWRRRDEEKGVSAHAERREPTDEELFAGLSPEDIALIEQLAADGMHNG